MRYKRFANIFKGDFMTTFKLHSEPVQDSWLDEQANAEFLKRHNPWALRDMAERLLEAANRGLWDCSDQARLERLRDIVLNAEGCIETGAFRPTADR